MRESASVSQSAVIRGCRVTAGWIVSSVLASNLAAQRPMRSEQSSSNEIGLEEKESYQVYSTLLD